MKVSCTVCNALGNKAYILGKHTTSKKHLDVVNSKYVKGSTPEKRELYKENFKLYTDRLKDTLPESERKYQANLKRWLHRNPDKSEEDYTPRDN